MGSKGKDQGTTVPMSFPTTTPPIIPDQNTAMLQIIVHMQATLGGLSKQVDGLESKIDKIADDVSRHGKWIYAANAIIILLIGILGFLAKAIWDVMLAKINTPTPH